MTNQFLRPLSVHLVAPAILWTLLLTAESRGELITFQFSGTVTGISIDDFRPELQGIDFPDVGDPFRGFYTFDSTAQDTASSSEQGSFRTVLPHWALMVSIGDFRFEGRASGILTFQNHYEVGDFIPSIELTSDPALAETLDRNNFSLVVRKENLFADPNILPLTPPSLEGAFQRYLVMQMDNRNNVSPFPWVRMVATLDSLTLVPEPASLLLLVFVAVFSIEIRRRR
jgi:hypothetical protein